MSTSLFQPLRFKIIFYTFWFSWAEAQAIVLNHFGFSWKLALTDSAISNILLAAFSAIIARSFEYYTPQKNKYTYITALVVTLSLIWLFLSRSIIIQFAGNVPDYDTFFSKSFVIRGAYGFLINGCMALISMLWYTSQDQKETEERKTEAEKLAREAELFNLRQQLQPHFLFNSLNSINALITLQPQKARTMIQQLSDFLRGTLRKEENQWVSLEDELQQLQLYLDIEKVRFGHRLATEVLTTDNARLAKIPAMLLQPIVENAIKFGLYDTTGEITISVDSDVVNGNLQVKVSNPFDSETSMPLKGTGFGLSSVKRRLYLLFANNNLLSTAVNQTIFTTTIVIPQPAL